MKYGLAIIVALAFSVESYGQTHQYSNFMFNQAVINPAAIGRENAIQFTALYRNQWLGIEGSPSMQTFSVHSPIQAINSSAGVYVVNEMQGEERSTYMMLAYAYKIPTRIGDFSAGLSGGVIQNAVDGSKLRAPEGSYSDNTLDHNDNYIPDHLVSDITPDFNVGVYYNRKQLYAGLSVTNLLEGKVNLETPTDESEIRFPRNYALMGGYKFEFSRKLNLRLNVLVKTDFIKTQADYNVIVQYNNNIYGGLSFRGSGKNTNDALVAMFGFTILKKLGVGYSYDFSLSSLNEVNGGSHEVFLNYKLNIKELLSPGKIIYSPRFL